MGNKKMWDRYRKYLYVNSGLGLMLDISRMNFKNDFFEKMEPLMQRAFKAMDELESGMIANPDEKRMVGHYWLRNSKLAPTAAIKKDVDSAIAAIKRFAKKVHDGDVTNEKGKPFKNVLVVGIGGSALGPQFAASALGGEKDRMTPYFFDNTDPDGMDLVLGRIGKGLADTLTVVISKSGGTIETKNGMIEARAAYEKRGLKFEKHVVAVTGDGSNLDQTAKKGKWPARFPMWDWVGGRTSVTSAVGMLPAALQGLDIDQILAGAKACDDVTRSKKTMENPAALMALMWHYATGGRGSRDLVILPYKDRLGLFTKYLQQLVMESLGKELDSGGKTVNQGLTVYGNKGATDQHAYVQQLRDGLNNFFVTFVEVLRDRRGKSVNVSKDATAGDYLNVYFQGTREALYDNGRESMTLTIDDVDPFRFGVLTALFERTVGLYASLIGINAYHQPGVEAGKRMANAYVELQLRAFDFLRTNRKTAYTAEELADAMGVGDDAEPLFKILMHAGSNPDHDIEIAQSGDSAPDSKFRYVG
jgi:glucose-6-phosphate isomerase